METREKIGLVIWSLNLGGSIVNFCMTLEASWLIACLAETVIIGNILFKR